MFKGIVTCIKAFGKGKAMLEAIDDDVDLNGTADLDELKACFENVKSSALALWGHLSAGFAIAARLADHIAKADK